MLLDFLADTGDAVDRMVENYVGERAAFREEGMSVRGFFKTIEPGSLSTE